MRSAPLAEQVAAAKAGDREAFAALVKRFQGIAVGLAYARLRDADVARDVAQEAFLDAYVHLGQLREDAAFPGWFRRVVAKHCDRQLRRKRLPVEPLEGAPPVRDPSRSASAELVHRQEHAWMRARIEALPDDERLVVALYYFAGEDQAAISEFLGLPVSTVKKRLYSARERLKQESLDAVNEALAALRYSDDASFSRTIQLFLAVLAGDASRVGELLDEEPGLVDARQDWSRRDALERHLPVPNRATPLVVAAERGNVAMLELLLDRGAHIDGDCGCPSGESPLWAAIAADQGDAARLLLERGADPNRVTATGSTPLHVAAIRNATALARELLGRGANPELRDRGGRSPADWARLKQSADVLEVLCPAEGRLHRKGTAEIPRRAERGGLLETGIKAIDLLAPLRAGSTVRVYGSAGVGRNVLVGELVTRLLDRHATPVLMAAWAEEPWERDELDELLGETGLRPHARTWVADPDSSAAVRHSWPAESLDAALERAADSQLPALLVVFEAQGHRVDVEALFPRLRDERVTVFVVPDWRSAAGGPSPLTAPFDSQIALDPELARIGHWPAVHPLWTHSQHLSPERAGARHCRLALETRELLAWYRQENPKLSPQLADELPGAEGVRARRARQLQAFLTQPFHSAEPFTAEPAHHVSLDRTLSGTERILAGELDDLDPQLLLFKGALVEP